MQTEPQIQIVIAHYGLDRKITQAECETALVTHGTKNIFIAMDAGNAKLNELYDLPFENIALAQQRLFAEILKPVLDEYPTAQIAYFGLTPIPVGLHLGYLVGNTHPFVVYQWHHSKNKWLADTASPVEDYVFSIKPLALPQEKQKGKGNVIVRIGISFTIDQQSTYGVVPNPANEFDIELEVTHPDSLYSQENIHAVVEAFQNVLNTYSSKLTDREQVHLFISSSAGLPFALGTRINTNLYPYIQTYQYDRKETPKHREAILISKEADGRIVLSDADRQASSDIRIQWQEQLENKLKPFIQSITGTDSDSWLKTICKSSSEYDTISKHYKLPWSTIITIAGTSLIDDKIDLAVKNIEDGFGYIEKTNTWLLDDGFLAGLKKRLEKSPMTDLMQAGRLFLFHEALHYSKSGHRLTREIANGIGQFPKVIEEADYQADVWGLLNEYRYCCMYEPGKLKNGLKEFFCNAIDTAVETMWSFVDNGMELSTLQIRSMNRFLNWYWVWLLIEELPGTGTLDDIVFILLHKPVIEFAGAPMELRAHRTYYKLNAGRYANLQLAAFVNNRVHRFAPTQIDDIITGFRQLKGEKIKAGLKSFQVSVY